MCGNVLSVAKSETQVGAVKTLAQVVGHNARALRLAAGVSLEDFAVAARNFGLSWSTGRVGDFESGRVAPTFPTLYAVALTLRSITGSPVTLAHLFYGDGWVELSESLTVPLGDIQAAVSGKPVTVGQMVPNEAQPSVKLRQADFNFCKELGLTPQEGQKLMLALWKRTFTEERDFRAGPDANAQRKGQISRQIVAELYQQMFDANSSEMTRVERLAWRARIKLKKAHYGND